MNLIPLAYAATKESAIPDFYSQLFMKVLAAAALFFISFVIATMLKRWVQARIRKHQGGRHEELVILYGRIVFSSAFGLGALIALMMTGVPLGWFSGGLGLGLAFALQSILANFFAGLILLSNQKFNIGDFVILDSNTSGTIVDIQSRATSLRAFDGAEITIPNTQMLQAKVKCYTKNPIRRHAINMYVGYETNLKAASDLILKVVKAHEDVEPTPAPIVLVSEIADSAVVLEVRYWTVSKTKWWVIKSELTAAVYNALTDAGIDIPYPVQTIRIDKDSSDLLAKNSTLIKFTQPKSVASLEKAEVFRSMPEEDKSPVAKSPLSK